MGLALVCRPLLTTKGEPMTTISIMLAEVDKLAVAQDKLAGRSDQEATEIDAAIRAFMMVAAKTPASSFGELAEKAKLLQRYIGIYAEGDDAFDDIPEYPLAMSIARDISDLHEKQ